MSAPQRSRMQANEVRSWKGQKFETMNRTGYLLGLLLLAVIIPSIDAATQHPVNTFSDSSTVLGQTVTSSTLVWESYDAKDARQLHFAVEGGKCLTQEENYTIYVCRVYIDGLYSSGHTEKVQQSQVCVAGQKRYKHFDVLVNRGHLGKIAWRPWNKLNGSKPIGAIQVGIEKVYVARHQLKKENEHHHGADYSLGHLDPVGFGKIKVVEENNEEKHYDEGEILVETQPFRYELRDIKIKKISLEIKENLTELASSILKNSGDQYSVVETVMSYEYDHIQNWGSHEGTARGLPTKIYEKDSATPTEVHWGLKYNEKRYETKSVHTKLYPGTALNVTLKGKYVTLQAPYSAKLYAFYNGLEDSVSRTIESDVLKSYLKDVTLERGPIYFLENGTLVPTTTTSTTSTTSTTTHATTTTGQPKPIQEPPMVHIKTVGEENSGPDSIEKSLHDSPVNNEIPHSPDNLSEPQQEQKALAGIGLGNSGNNGNNLHVQQQWNVLTTIAILFVASLLNV